MPLTTIIWNDVYAAKKEKRVYSEVRIAIHYQIMDLERRGATTAIVGYVAHSRISLIHLIMNVREAGWHTSGRRPCGDPIEHLAVRFFCLNGVFVATHHVYRENEHYPAYLFAE